MTLGLQALLDKQNLVVASLRKRLTAMDAVLSLSTEERTSIVGQIIHAEGKLEAFKEALATEQEVERVARQTVEEVVEQEDANASG